MLAIIPFDADIDSSKLDFVKHCCTTTKVDDTQETTKGRMPSSPKMPNLMKLYRSSPSLPNFEQTIAGLLQVLNLHLCSLNIWLDTIFNDAYYFLSRTPFRNTVHVEYHINGWEYCH
mmetsp:Transcript_16483/g.23249  ORF Transcript_16483/g.23249 Transcript_16483/m.23249 type:complete len:117 (-) Transcript_16483:395-745(-)